MSSQSSTFLLWLAPSFVSAMFAARLSVWLQPHFSPIVLFPLLTGAALGLVLCAWLYLVRLSHRRLAVVGTVLVAMTAALAEHGFFYFDYRGAFEATRSRNEPKIAIVAGDLQPVSFIEYMRAHATRARDLVLWVGNSLLTVIAATGVVVWWLKSHSPNLNSLRVREGTEPL